MKTTMPHILSDEEATLVLLLMLLPWELILVLCETHLLMVWWRENLLTLSFLSQLFGENLTSNVGVGPDVSDVDRSSVFHLIGGVQVIMLCTFTTHVDVAIKFDRVRVR